jgi:DNA-binding XRE family transcriptional regulator
MPNEKQSGRHPNELRAARSRACLTRAQVSELTKRLATVDSLRFAAVSEATIKSLELGWSRPRPRTATTLARALDARPEDIFTSGIDDSNRKNSGPPRKSQ